MQQLSEQYAASVPRYTSYPTAPHFHAGVTNETYRDWLGSVPAGSEISLYIHVPFCDRLCWFCACHTKQILRYGPLSRYLEALYKEIDTVGSLLDPGTRVSAVHFGGGSPTMLKPEDIGKLDRKLRAAFRYLPQAEISVEIDPNDMEDARFDALAQIGMTRVSLGVQDFDPEVQAAINREQSFEQTKAVVDGARLRGVSSVNLDLLYGLPHQTCESVEETMRQALTLRPDRIALFGYAHVPWMKKHQTMIDEAALPGTAQRFEQVRRAGALILASGYEAIGLDHFARPGDSLAMANRSGAMRRNFQGYTVDQSDTLIGLGASSIGKLPQGYIQNCTGTGEYERMVAESGLAAVRGYALSDDDRIRAWVIERLMCDFSFSQTEMQEQFGDRAGPIIHQARLLAASDSSGQFERRGDSFTVTESARPLVRLIASKFDAYLGKGSARHSAAV
ncbi:oxygen-independent coproporphyrinogen III oxidase [Mesorhizobium muleiense]|uniref:oxygen-independent coproporphyrinogen III oxidase n=1 Tax=Mesorhizobium muleiense TaxID=1004279 RepID=UPI003AFA0B99